MEILFEKLAGFLNRRPKVIVAFMVVLVAISFYGMTKVTMDTSWKTYSQPESPEGIIYNQYDQTYSSSSIILIVETNMPTSPVVLEYLDRLESTLRQQQNIKSVTSIVDLMKLYNGGKVPTTQADVDRILNEIPPATKNLYMSSNVLTLVQAKMTPGLSQDVKTTVLNNVQSVVDASNPPPGVTVSLSGDTAFHQQMGSELTASMGVLIGAAMVLMVIVMGILFSYVSQRFLPVLIVFLGLLTSFGIMGIAGIKLNMAVVGAFPVLIGLGIDYAIQFHARFDEESRKGPLDQAAFTTITKTGPAVFYAMLATCMGFLAMFVSPVPMVQSFGLVAIIGVMSCYLMSLLGIPVIGILTKYKPKPQKGDACYAVGEDACDYTAHAARKASGGKKKWSYAAFLTSTSVKIAKNPIPVLLVALVIAAIGFQVDTIIPIQTNQNDFVPSDMPAKIQSDKVTRIMGATATAPIIIRGGDVTALPVIQWIQRYQDYELDHHSELTQATSIVTYILDYNHGTMPETQGQLNDVLSRIPEGVKDQYLDGHSSTVIEFNTINMEMSTKNSLKEGMIADMESITPPPGIQVDPTGDFDLYTSLISSLSESKDLMTLLGFILVFLFLLVVYRQIHAVSPLVPIVAVVGWNAIAMYSLGIAYSPLTATLGSMTIGVAAEYTILVMERFSEEHEKTHDTMSAIQHAVERIGSAITVSGLATFFGFSALCLSSFPIISNFGVTTLIAVGFSLIGAIFIMPAILSLVGRVEDWLESRKYERTHASCPLPAEE